MTKRILIAALAALIAGTGIFLALGGPEPPRDLERLTEASEAAGDRSATITANLERIAENLAEGASLPGDTEEIRSLTDKQRDSLKRLAVLLEEQLEALAASTGALAGTQETTSDLARLSKEQVRILRRTVAALQELRDHAARAAAASAKVDTAARYGARLAEDSQKAFSQ
ncbi:MAG: hypothetical protein JJE05_09290 [Actinobacteria bacterium]|nr:hypothetical protein [Actinomycetota bacterium]